MKKVYVILEPLYHSTRVLEVVESLNVAKAVMCEAVGLNTGKFCDLNPSYWWNKETRAAGIVVHSIGSAGDISVSGWSIEEHTVRVRAREVLN